MDNFSRDVYLLIRHALSVPITAGLWATAQSTGLTKMFKSINPSIAFLKSCTSSALRVQVPK